VWNCESGLGTTASGTYRASGAVARKVGESEDSDDNDDSDTRDGDAIVISESDDTESDDHSAQWENREG